MEIREYIKKSTLTQEQFAKKAGISTSYLKHIMAGTRTPTVSTAKEISGATSGLVTAATILGVANPKTSEDATC